MEGFFAVLQSERRALRIDSVTGDWVRAKVNHSAVRKARAARISIGQEIWWPGTGSNRRRLDLYRAAG
jgi:hypothetical protein